MNVDRAGYVRFSRSMIGLLLAAFTALAGTAFAEDEHEDMVWTGPGTCLECHEDEAHDVHGSVMYQWKGEAPAMVNGPAVQGKIAGGVNSYCINIIGNWNACGGCHIGLGVMPEDEATSAQLSNIDCMICHQKEYRRKKVGGVFVPDEEAMAVSMDEAARTVHEPERFNCLLCHAKAGGGDAVKRGDLSLAHADTVDEDFDVHMATTGENLRCQDCHTTTDHLVAGKGSDLRPNDSSVEMGCLDCHENDIDEHGGDFLGNHLARVACQVCHIPVYAKDASDSSATEATEVHRTWLDSHSTEPPFHPVLEKRNDLTPRYRFWNRLSHNFLLGDVAVLDSTTGRYPTSRPQGDVADSEAKLYAFKYKTALQPMVSSTGQLIALDTSVFFASADAAAATVQGLVNMGLDPALAYEWVETDTFQMLNHEVAKDNAALRCDNCHGSTDRMDLQGELGYALMDDEDVVCFQCHGDEEEKPFEELHNKHVADEGFDCSWCHGFSRPERFLTLPPEDDTLFADGFESGDVSAW